MVSYYRTVVVASDTAEQVNMQPISISAFVLVIALGAVAPASAGGLGDVLGSVLGDGDSGGLVTISSGTASDSGLVNVGLGGSESLVDVNVAGSSGGLLSASVGSSDGGLINAGVDVLHNTVDVDVNVGGPNLVGVHVGVPGHVIPTLPVVPRRPGLPRVLFPSAPDQIVANVGGGSGGNGGDVACDGESASDVSRLMSQTNVSSNWNRASNISVQRVTLCTDVQGWLQAELKDSGLGNRIEQAVAADALIEASLNRTTFKADRVFAVRQSGATLTVYVY